MQTICHNIINKYHAARVRNDISLQIVAIYCHVVPIWRYDVLKKMRLNLCIYLLFCIFALN